MEVDDNNWNSKLLELIADSFPQFKFPEVEYEEKTKSDGSIDFNARIKLLGQSFNSGPLKSKEEALESVSAIAYEVIKEFNALVFSETNSSLKCEALSSLFRPLQDEAKRVASTVSQEALRSVSEIKNRLIEVENEKINQKVKTKSEKIVEKMQGTVQIEKNEPAKVSKIEEYEDEVDEGTRSAGISLSPLKIEQPKKEQQEVKERKTVIGAPIPAFYEFVEKQSSNDMIVFDDYNKGHFFGSRLRWGKRYWVSPAEFKQKKDARNYAAVMACIECFGEGFTFEGIDPRMYYNWTRESVRQASDSYSFADSDELLSEENNKISRESTVDPSKLKVEPLADGRKFTSVLNEICQKLRMTPPNYQIASVNTLTNYYVCTVRNFHDLPQIESVPFTKKNESKEDAAGKIYYILKQKGIVDEASRIIGRMKAFELAAQGKVPVPPLAKEPVIERGNVPLSTSNRRIPSTSDDQLSTRIPKNESYPQMMNNVNVAIPSVNKPPAPIQVPVMNPMSIHPSHAAAASMMPMMMMMSQMTQQSQQPGQPAPFDPIMIQSFMEMSRQWQAFLAWQQQQPQQQKVTVPNYSPESLTDAYEHYRGSPHESQHDNRSSHSNHTPAEYPHHPSSEYSHNPSGEYNNYQLAEYNRDHRETRRDYRNIYRPGREQSPTDPRRSREVDGEYSARKRSYEESRRKK